MTDEQAEALGRRYLTAGGRWYHRMRAIMREGANTWSAVVDGVDHGDRNRRALIGGHWTDEPGRGGLPDFRDPATLGCLVAEVRGRWGNPFISAQATAGATGWRLVEAGGAFTDGRWRLGEILATEPEAWIAALEAAP